MKHRGGAQGYLGLRWYLNLNVPRAKGGYVLVNYLFAKGSHQSKGNQDQKFYPHTYCGGIQQLPLKPVF